MNARSSFLSACLILACSSAQAVDVKPVALSSIAQELKQILSLKFLDLSSKVYLEDGDIIALGSLFGGDENGVGRAPSAQSALKPFLLKKSLLLRLAYLIKENPVNAAFVALWSAGMTYGIYRLFTAEPKPLAEGASSCDWQKELI